MILPNTAMVRQDLVDFVALANATTALTHGPFALFNPFGLPSYFDMTPPYTVTDRGAYHALTTYQAGDQVTQSGYQFISVVNGNAVAPLDGSGNPGAGWRQPWYSCYQRIRTQTQAAAAVQQAASLITVWDQAVSGPWPCQTPSMDYDQLAFYYGDTGNSESVHIVGSTPGFPIAYGTLDLRQTELPTLLDGTFAGAFPLSSPSSPGDNPQVFTAITGPPDQFRYTYSKATVIQVAVGGVVPVPVNATFTVKVDAFRGWTLTQSGDPPTSAGSQDATDPLTLLTIDTSRWMGGSVSTSFSGWSSYTGSHANDFDRYSGLITITFTVNATIAPGVYSIQLTSTADPNNFADGTTSVLDNGDGTSTWSGFNEWGFSTFLNVNGQMDFAGGIDKTFTTAVEVAGIHDSKRVLKIPVSSFDPGSGLPTGIFGGQELYNIACTGGTYFVDGTVIPPAFNAGIFVGGWTSLRNTEPPDPDPSYVFKKTHWFSAFGFTITTTTVGFWLGKTPPINGLGLMPDEQMQYNKMVTTITTGAPGTHTDPQQNLYLGFTLPYSGGSTFLGTDVQRAYGAADAPGWLPASNAGELLPWPKRWKPLVFYPAGWTILDSYGNLQTNVFAGWSGTTEPGWPTVVGALTAEPTRLGLHPPATQSGAQWHLARLLRDAPTIGRSTDYATGQTGFDANGNLQKAIVGGQTPLTPPTWATTLGATTADGPVTWELQRIQAPFAPAVARITPPIYPHFWQNPVTGWTANRPVVAGEVVSDSNGNTQQVLTKGITGATEPVWQAGLNLQTADGTVAWKLIRLEQRPLTDTNRDPRYPTPPNIIEFPFSFRPQGWWIYRVALNRIPQSKTIQKPPSDPVAVTLGCIRNGVFVAFGTYDTGQIIDALWPVFTNTALAYRCSERVDVQAEILTCGLSYSIWGNVSYPLAAAHLNDVAAILNVLVPP